MKAFLMAATAAVALAGAASPAEAAKLLFRSYNNAGILHGAMVFDTSKPYVIDGADRVHIPTFAISKLVYDPTVLRTNFDYGSAKPGAILYETLTGFYGSDVFGFDDTLCSCNLPPADAKLFGNVGLPGTTITFGEGNFGIYRNVRGPTPQESSYAKVGSVTITDVTNTAVNILAVTNGDNTRMEWLAVAFGDQPESTPLDNGGFRLTSFEGSIFNGHNGTKLTNIEFGPRSITANSSVTQTSFPYYQGPNTAPQIYISADATKSYDPGWFAGFRTDDNKIFYRAFTPAEALAGAVPEPGTWALMIIGIGMIGTAMRRRTRLTVAYQ